jgi:hydroxylamine dehydrogenase
MWYFDNLGAYKAAAHGDAAGVERGHAAMVAAFAEIQAEAATLRTLGAAEQSRDGRWRDPGDLWLAGPYTELNRASN